MNNNSIINNFTKNNVSGSGFLIKVKAVYQRGGDGRGDGGTVKEILLFMFVR